MLCNKNINFVLKSVFAIVNNNYNQNIFLYSFICCSKSRTLPAIIRTFKPNRSVVCVRKILSYPHLLRKNGKMMYRILAADPNFQIETLDNFFVELFF